MSRYRNLGQVIEVSLEPWGFDGWSVLALYNYNHNIEKYMVTMYCLYRNEYDFPSTIVPVFQIKDNEPVFTQELEGERGTIRSNICRVINYMCKKHIIDDFISCNCQEEYDPEEECCENCEYHREG